MNMAAEKFGSLGAENVGSDVTVGYFSSRYRTRIFFDFGRHR